MDVQLGDIDSDEDIDDELLLPEVLANIPFHEKKELLKFKRTHNEVSERQYLQLI